MQGTFAQACRYPSMQVPVGLLIATATLLALAAWPPTSDDVRLPPVVPAFSSSGRFSRS
jgi:hypothetical protein